MAPVIRALQRLPDQFECRICVTAQHREMLDQVLDLFEIRPDIDLDLMMPGQSLSALTSRVLLSITDVLRRESPNCILVQGDTTTVMASALAAFYQRIPTAHVEAGLRTGDRYSPFPEEVNRRIVSVLATYHFAPTHTAVNTLLSENIPQDTVFLTGNTVIDALLWATNLPPSKQALALLRRFDIAPPSVGESCPATVSPRLILVTAHRRENVGHPLASLCRGLLAIVKRNPAVRLAYPVHLNPNVRDVVFRILGGHERIFLLDPLSYETFIHLMKAAFLVLTDSGGIQEEAPSLGKPVLVLREKTERPEAVGAGTVKVIGTDTERIVAETERLLYDEVEYQSMAQAVSPYGDGHASERITRILLEQLA